jgi:hypothetical protein
MLVGARTSNPQAQLLASTHLLASSAVLYYCPRPALIQAGLVRHSILSFPGMPKP